MENKANNADRLIERILADAQGEADRLFAASAEEAEHTALLAQDQIFSIEKDGAARAEALRRGVMERSRTNASLDSRKYALKARRELIDRAFELSGERLNGSEGQQRLYLLKKLLLREAEGGETVRPAASDAQNVAAILAEVNGELAARGKAPLSIGEIASGMEGGFALIGRGYEKNCSFTALLREVRAAEESAVAAILFNLEG